MRVRYRLKARLDIKNIHQYIEQINGRAAREVVARIRSSADNLGVWPHMGHAGRATGTFEHVVSQLPYVIVYEVHEPAEEVAIVAIFHCAQDR